MARLRQQAQLGRDALAHAAALVATQVGQCHIRRRVRPTEEEWNQVVQTHRLTGDCLAADMAAPAVPLGDRQAVNVLYQRRVPLARAAPLAAIYRLLTMRATVLRMARGDTVGVPLCISLGLCVALLGVGLPPSLGVHIRAAGVPGAPLAKRLGPTLPRQVGIASAVSAYARLFGITVRGIVRDVISVLQFRMCYTMGLAISTLAGFAGSLVAIMAIAPIEREEIERKGVAAGVTLLSRGVHTGIIP
jgi:hypothetical protein